MVSTAPWTRVTPFVLLGTLILIPVLGSLVAVQAADEAWETEVRREEKEEDRLLETAKRRGTTRQIVARYGSRLSRQPSALNHYLLARALYHDGDVAGAERHLRDALRLEPRFWFARLRLAILAAEGKKPEEAEAHLAEVLRVKPREPDALKVLALIKMDAEDWDEALRVLESLVSIDPANEAVRRNIATCHMAKEDWESALRELRVLRGRHPKDRTVRFFYARALYQTGKLKEASGEFESLVRMDPGDARSLDALRVIYFKLEDRKSLIKTLQRMLALIRDPEAQTEIREAITALEEGQPLRPPEMGEDAAVRQETMNQLIARCMDPADVDARREALQLFYEAEPPYMPAALVRRVHPDLEADPICRSWILRIIGSLRNADLAQVAAFGLYDPDPAVRAIAAESLGEIQTASGLLYLMPYFLGMKVSEPPTSTEVQQQNAGRNALLRLTRGRDLMGDREEWVVSKDLAGLREDWQIWLATPEGVAARLRGIEDLESQGELRPELYLIEDVMDPELSIARAAYGVLLRRKGKPNDDPVAEIMWPRFPVFPEEKLTSEGMAEVRGAVRGWWEAWLRTRKEMKNEAGAGGGG